MASQEPSPGSQADQDPQPLRGALCGVSAHRTPHRNVHETPILPIRATNPLVQIQEAHFTEEANASGAGC